MREGGRKGWMEGGMKGWMDGWMDGWREGGREGGREREREQRGCCLSESRSRGLANVNLRMECRLQKISHVQKKGGDDFDGTHNGQIVSDAVYFNRRIRMSMERFICKSMKSCDGKGSTLRAVLRNPVINSNEFACPSVTIMFNLNWPGLKQQGQR